MEVKKVCLFITCLFAAIPVGALEAVYDGEGNLMTQEEIAEAERMVAIGERIQREGERDRMSRELNVPQYFQTDSRWANSFIPCGHAGHTYGAVGCAITSYAMVFKYYGSNVTPVDVATTCQRVSPPCCNFSSAPLCQAYGRSRLNSGDDYTTSQIKSFIIGSINTGKPAIIRLSKNGGNHFVVGYRYYENYSGQYVINIKETDPRIGYQNIEQYLNSGWGIDFATRVS